MRKTARLAAVVGIACLTLAGCGDRPEDEAADPTESASESPSESESSPTASAPAGFKACMVSDSGGFDDKSFNQTSYAGLQNAADNLGIATAEAESQVEADFKDNIGEMVSQKCNSITTVGFLLGDATLAAAKQNPEIDFSIVDFAYFDESGTKNVAPPNVKGLTFNTAEPAFLAGYLAAAKSESGTVGTFGGVNIPTVTIFMTGFVQGVERYNEDQGADVQVIGWNPETEEGSFTNDFENKNLGQTTAEGMIQQGADVIMPVAGPAGLGGLQAAQDADVKAIWVDTDGCVSAEEYCDVLLSSVMKGMDVAVETAITDSAAGSFSNEPYTGTLENGGVALAPFGPNAEVDDALAQEIETLKQGIIDGSITVG